LLDEMYSEVIAVELRARGHDALSVREMAPTLAGAPDEELLSNAVAQGRTLLTDNVRDFDRVPGLVVRQPAWPQCRNSRLSPAKRSAT